MKILGKTIAVFFLVLGTGLAHAQGKIAVLNLQQAIFNTEEAKQQIEKLRQTDEYMENKKEAEGIKKGYDALVEEFSKNRDVMSAEQQAEQAKKIQSKQADFEHVAKKLQQSEVELSQKIFQQMLPKAQKVLADLIKIEGIGLLLDSKAALHAEVGYSIDAKVTDKLNQAP